MNPEAEGGESESPPPRTQSSVPLTESENQKADNERRKRISTDNHAGDGWYDQ